jgi:hypothetical protein
MDRILVSVCLIHWRANDACFGTGANSFDLLMIFLGTAIAEPRAM